MTLCSSMVRMAPVCDAASGDRLGVDGLQRVHAQDARFDALGHEPLRDGYGELEHGAGRNQREVFSVAQLDRLAEFKLNGSR